MDTTCIVPEFYPMKSVYSYHFPETAAVLAAIGELTRQAELFRVTTDAAKAQDLLASLATPPLTVTSTPRGKLDLDMIHVPIIDRIVAQYSELIHGLDGFANRYPGHGSSDGLYHLLANLSFTGVKCINVLDGEYEGYGIQAANCNMTVNVHEPDDPKLFENAPGYWFVSNPSARNGNVLPSDFIHKLCEAGNKVVADLTYVGLTAPQVFDVSHPNVIACVMSFSKPYGVFRLRLGGFIFTREPFNSLYGTKWFKDCERLLQALALAERIGPKHLYSKYRPVQELIIADLNRKFGLELIASDVLLLAHLPVAAAADLPADKQAMIAPFKRESYFRFCLTPYLEEYETASIE